MDSDTRVGRTDTAAGDAIGGRRGARPRRGIPDGVIAGYFALFPALVAAFLAVQAARADSSRHDGPAGRAGSMTPAR